MIRLCKGVSPGRARITRANSSKFSCISFTFFSSCIINVSGCATYCSTAVSTDSADSITLADSTFLIVGTSDFCSTLRVFGLSSPPTVNVISSCDMIVSV